MANRFVLNETSYHGKGAIQEIVITKHEDFKKHWYVIDPDFTSIWCD